MTCIVGLEHNGRVYIGGDSAGISGMRLTVRADSKVFKTGPFLMGFTSSFRMGQILRYQLACESLPPAAAPLPVLEKYMATTFIDAVRKALETGGWLTKDKGVEEGGTFLVGTQGRLFAVYDDMQVGQAAAGYLAVGCGGELALGALHATAGYAGPNPSSRVQTALEAAAYHNAGVCAPFTIQEI